MLTVSGDSPQANVINYANGSPAQGTAVDPVDAIQTLTVDATGGTFTLTYTPWTDTSSNGVIDAGELGTPVTTDEIAYDAPAMQTDEVAGGPQSVQRLLGATVGGASNLDVEEGRQRLSDPLHRRARRSSRSRCSSPIRSSLLSGGNGEQDVLKIDDSARLDSRCGDPHLDLADRARHAELEQTSSSSSTRPAGRSR